MNLSEFSDRSVELRASESSEQAAIGFLDSIAVIDQRAADFEQLGILSGYAMPLLLDDNGKARKYAPFLLDVLPGPRTSDANISSPAYMDLPPSGREPDSRAAILVSFGGEDPSRLSFAVLKSLVHYARIAPERISVVLNPDDVKQISADIPAAIRIIEPTEQLKSRLTEFGLVICSYGLTAWEALAAGAAVLSVEPSAYHYRLSRTAGIPSAGFVRPGRRSAAMLKKAAPAPGQAATDADRRVNPAAPARLPFPIRRRLRRLLDSPAYLDDSARRLAATLKDRKSLQSLISNLDAPIPRCLACGYLLPPVIERFPERSFYRCPRCTITGLYRFHRKDNEYGESYFHEEYRRQYGRSYLEDWNAIKALCRPRLNIISSRLPKGSAVLDIGCAYGVFLQAASEAGYRPFGTDVSEDAVAYIRANLAIPAMAGNFPQDNPADMFSRSQFDAITLWYVIEHFPRLDLVLEKLSAILAPGGVLALSTPNSKGIPESHGGSLHVTG